MKIKWMLFLCLVILPLSANAFDIGVTIDVDPATQKVVNQAASMIDTTAAGIKALAFSDPDRFIRGLCERFSVKKEAIAEMLLEKKISPHAIYMMSGISNISGKNIVDVESSYTRNQGQGWGVIAKEMGIKPGSPEVHALKRGKSSQKSCPHKQRKASKKKKHQHKHHKKGKGKGKGKS